MGSINDYHRLQRGGKKTRGSKFRNRILGQISLSLILFLIIAASVGADNIFGDSARYVAGEGIASESSWINFDGLKQDDQDGQTPDGTDDGTTSDPQDVSSADDALPPDFTAPASGIVVTDVAVAAGGFATSKGISIQGSAGQTVKATAGGSVSGVSESGDGYIIELTHSGGFVSVYQGLSEVKVNQGEQVASGDPIGSTADGELTFSLLLNDEEVNPLDYLFDND